MSRAQGTSLIELLVAIVIITIAVSGVLLSLVTSVRASADPQRQQQAVAIAEGYLEEIALQPIDDPNGGAHVVEGARSLYDDVQDYAGLSNSPPLDQTGAALAGLDGYAVAVSVSTSAVLGPGGSRTPSADTYRIDVRVTAAPNVDITLSSYRTRY